MKKKSTSSFQESWNFLKMKKIISLTNNRWIKLLTLFLPALGGISPYKSITWQQPVGIVLTWKNQTEHDEYLFLVNSFRCDFRLILSPMHPYKLQIALSTKSTLLFIKRKKCSNLTKSKKRTMVLTIFFSFRFVFREEKWHSIATAILTFVALNANSGGKCMRILSLWVCMAKVIHTECYKNQMYLVYFCV